MLSPSRSRWGLILWGTFALIALLIIGGIGYWHYAISVPPFRPRLPAMPEPNGYDRAVQILSRLSQAKRPPYPTKWPRGTLKQLRAHHNVTRPYLDRIRATLAREWRSPPTTAANVINPRFSHYAMFRECTRAFASESLLYQAEGRLDQAMASSLDAMELGSALSHGEGLTGRLVASACHMIGLQQAERLAMAVPRSGVSTALLRVRRIRSRWVSLEETILSESAASAALWTYTFRGLQDSSGRELITWFRSTAEDEGVWTTTRLALTPRRTVLVNQKEYHWRLQMETRKPVRRRDHVPAPPDAWSLVYPSIDPLGFSLKFEGMKTHLALLEAALAVRMHWLESGRYPARLGEISQRWLTAVPRDMWDQPVAYRLKAGAPVIYSLGPDGRDDGGAVVDYVTLSDTTRGDLVFGYLVRRLKR